jgi:D-inositol-3-phosphate glycosyltransferase
MKKILIWADSPTAPTGFGNVVRNILTNFPEDKYDFVIYATNSFSKINGYKYKIYNTPMGDDIYGLKRAYKIIKKEKIDILFIINDIWIADKMIDSLKSKIKTVLYFPVDAENHDPKWYDCLDKVDRAVVYNKFGLDVALKARSDIKYQIIEHGIDHNIFYKTHADRKEAKKILFKPVQLQKSFIVLNAGRNQPRKRLDITLRAFQKFAKDKKDVFLYMHSGLIDCHIDTYRMAKELGFEDKLMSSTKVPGPPNLNIEDLNKLYNACDVGINTGLGEGFGLPNAEHAATGAPQIVPDHSALTELYQDCGVLIPAKIPFTLDQISTTAKMVTIEDTVNALELLYGNKDLYNKHAELCYTKFNQEKYSWKYIAQQWYELFNSL